MLPETDGAKVLPTCDQIGSVSDNDGVTSQAQPQICRNILRQMPYLLFTPYHLM